MKPFKIERRGRPRKMRIATETVVDVHAVAQSMPHRREVPKEVRHDYRAECVLGVLFLNGLITDPQYRAGVLLRECVQRYHAVFSVPRHDRGAPPIDGLRRGGNVMPDDRARRAKEEHAKVYKALIDGVGVVGTRCVTHVVVYDQRIGKDSLEMLRRGLAKLSEYYGLTGRKIARTPQ